MALPLQTGSPGRGTCAHGITMQGGVGWVPKKGERKKERVLKGELPPARREKGGSLREEGATVPGSGSQIGLASCQGS